MTAPGIARHGLHDESHLSFCIGMGTYIGLFVPVARWRASVLNKRSRRSSLLLTGILGVQFLRQPPQPHVI